MKIRINQRRLPAILLLVSAVWIIGLLCLSYIQRSSITQISNLTARSVDDGIKLSWTSPPFRFDSYLELTVRSGDTVEVIKLSSDATGYVYRGGTHGQLHSFSLRLIQSGQQVGETLEDATLFLDMDQLPDLPLITIETQTGELPTGTVVYAPEGLLGRTVVDNAYVDAQFTMEQDGRTTVICSAQIRLRGNTSATGEKKPYKIKLQSKIDLLGRGDAAYADKEWVLLSNNGSFTLESGTLVGQLCGMEWQPAYIPVNLIINGDWQGCYYLVESVKTSEMRVNISSSGFIVERGAYWWAEEENAFKTPHQISKMGYTYKSPTAEELTEEQRKEIYDYFVDYEDVLLSADGSLTEYIDVNTFSGWLLTHDILGTMDAAGSNMFLYKYDMDPDAVTTSKLKMGPIWDVDSCFQCTDQWAQIHHQNIISADSLFLNPEFKAAYKQKWEALSEHLADDVISFLNAYANSYGSALQESADLDCARWQKESVSVEDAYEFVTTWFQSRTIWLNENIPAL